LRQQWSDAQGNIAEAAQILEALFQKFGIDPALASELKTAATQLGDEQLAAEADERIPGSAAPLMVQRDATQPHPRRGRDAPARRPRDLN
jgi:hypothetical protein